MSWDLGNDGFDALGTQFLVTLFVLRDEGTMAGMEQDSHRHLALWITLF
jgi:hypothetical protein